MLRVCAIFVSLGFGLEGMAMAEQTYSVSEEPFEGATVTVLRDGSGGREARVLPSVGNNCVAFRVRKGGETVDLIYTPPDPETLQGRPSGYGVPILFPWPNRIDGGRFVFNGEDYRLDTPSPGAHASHGFVLNRPWEVVGAGASDAEGAWVQSRFRSADFPEVGRQFPFPFEVTATYRLKDGALELEIEAVNTGTGAMPVGLGMHPYFPLPLAEGGSRDLCTVQMPVETYWPLREDMIPTGEILQVSGRYDVRQPTQLKGQFYDNVWSGVVLTDGWSRCVYTDPTAGIRVVMAADSIFRELVLYAPEQRPVVCFEPYTCVTNAVNLDAQGVDAGLIRLGPGEKLKGRMRILAEVE